MAISKEVKESRSWHWNEDGVTCTVIWDMLWLDSLATFSIGTTFEAYATAQGETVSADIPTMRLIDKTINPKSNVENVMATVTLLFSSNAKDRRDKVADIASSIKERMSVRTTSQTISGNPDDSKTARAYWDYVAEEWKEWDVEFTARGGTSVGDENAPDVQLETRQLEYHLTMYGSYRYYDEMIKAVGTVNSKELLTEVYVAIANLLGNTNSSAPSVQDVGAWMLDSVNVEIVNYDLVQYDMVFLTSPYGANSINFPNKWNFPYGLTSSTNMYVNYDIWGQVLSNMALVEDPPSEALRP